MAVSNYNFVVKDWFTYINNDLMPLPDLLVPKLKHMLVAYCLLLFKSYLLYWTSIDTLLSEFPVVSSPPAAVTWWLITVVATP